MTKDGRMTRRGAGILAVTIIAVTVLTAETRAIVAGAVHPTSAIKTLTGNRIGSADDTTTKTKMEEEILVETTGDTDEIGDEPRNPTEAGTAEKTENIARSTATEDTRIEATSAVTSATATDHHERPTSGEAGGVHPAAVTILDLATDGKIVIGMMAVVKKIGSSQKSATRHRWQPHRRATNQTTLHDRAAVAAERVRQ